MDNSEATLQCQNLTCLASNSASNKFCQKCGTPLVRRYLWVLGDWAKTYYHPGDLLDERYLFKQPQIVLDTKPSLAPLAPEEFPHHITPYLKLFSHRLHIPQIYGYIPTPDERIDMTIWLLEYGTIPTDSNGELKYPQLLPPLEQVWPEASAVRQLNWLWQIANLWQPLMGKKVVSSLLNPHLLRVNERTIQLLQLQLDTDTTVNLKQLGNLWSGWVANASPTIQDFLAQLSQQLEEEFINRSEQVVSILDQALLEIRHSQQRTYQIFTASDAGPTREHNEDSCYPITDEAIIIDEQQIPLAIVCDGIGGQEGGEIASNLAVEILSQEIIRFSEKSTAWNPNIHISSLEKAIKKSNDDISERNDNEHRQERQRMGTTLVMGLGYFHEMYVAHVGDSRVYLITPTTCHQITTDDDLASREVRLGYLAYRDAVQYPNAGALVQALGMSSSTTLHPTIQRFVLDESCVFLLCSDGLSDYDRIEQFWESEIVPIISENKDVAEVGRQLIKIANEKNGHDNVTIALISCQVQPKEEHYKTPLSFSDLVSSVSSVSGPTFIEDTEDVNIQEDLDDIPTVISPASPTSIPTSLPSPASVPASRASRTAYSLPIVLGLLSLGIVIVAGGYFGQKFLFNNQSSDPISTPTSPQTSVSLPSTLTEGQVIEITTPTQLQISTEDALESPAVNPISVVSGSVFKILDTKDNAMLLENCSPQAEDNFETNKNRPAQFWILKSSFNSENYNIIDPASAPTRIAQKCQVFDSLKESPSATPLTQPNPQ